MKNYFLSLLFLCLCVSVEAQERIKLSEIDKDAVDNSKEIYSKFDSLVKTKELYKKYNVKIEGNYCKTNEIKPIKGSFVLTIKDEKIKYRLFELVENPFSNKDEIIPYLNEAIVNSVLSFSHIKKNKEKARWIYDKKNDLWKLRFNHNLKGRIGVSSDTDLVISIKLENDFIKEAFLDVTPSGKVNKLSIHSIYLEKNNVGYLSHVEYYEKSNQTGNVLEFNLDFIPN
ncbi:hypothetical protein EDL99_03130 [Ornithobacterium rhinotracheale]|uniref:hypothetical protein n=1 Tax=Ornithobacterium rhinotracheale TaxID=28251 RepID=UPI00129CCDC8|nr:hypothetical protein [Ornithobacterium rhinotracheale]MRJ07881.1 hypothetical protein [Ornithobacterium rhinotracheale]UOH78605.1 hypothetical protein MT996_03835 [Ornithobacterium rhinotracheale]